MNLDASFTHFGVKKSNCKQLEGSCMHRCTMSTAPRTQNCRRQKTSVYHFLVPVSGGIHCSQCRADQSYTCLPVSTASVMPEPGVQELHLLSVISKTPGAWQARIQKPFLGCEIMRS